MKTAIQAIANVAAIGALSVAAGSASHSKAPVSHSNRPLTHNKAYNARPSLAIRASRSEDRWIPTTTTTQVPPTTTKHQWHGCVASAQQSCKTTVTVPVVTTAPGRSRIRACIIENESGGDPLAHNAHSSAAGIAQWLTTTWANWGEDVTDPTTGEVKHVTYHTADLAPMDVQQQRMDYDMSLSMAHIQSEWAAQRGNCGF